MKILAKTRMICQTKANLLIWLVFVFSRCQLIGHKVKIEFFQHLTSRWTLRFFVIKILPRTKKTFLTLANSSFIEYIREFGEFVSPVVVFGQEYIQKVIFHLCLYLFKKIGPSCNFKCISLTLPGLHILARSFEFSALIFHFNIWRLNYRNLLWHLVM